MFNLKTNNEVLNTEVTEVEEVKVKVVKKKAKKIDVKKAAKEELSKLLVEFLTAQGIEVKDNAEDFGFTGGTLVAQMENTDVQIKFITPKAGLERYQEVVYVDEVEEINEEAALDEEENANLVEQLEQ